MTGWPPLTKSGLAKLVVTTSTDMPGSMRMPLNCVRDLVVIKNLGIVLFVLVINVVIEYKVSRFPHPAICLFLSFRGEKGGRGRPNPTTRLSKRKIAVNLNDEYQNRHSPNRRAAGIRGERHGHPAAYPCRFYHAGFNHRKETERTHLRVHA